MKTALIALAAAGLATGVAFAQAPAPEGHTVATTPTKTAAGAVTSKTTAKGAPVTHTAASIACSKQADAQGLHGKARQKMRSACKQAAAGK